MSLSDLFTDILCALSNDHIVKEPVNLTCSHGVCKSCLPKESNKIKCKICETEQKIDANENIFIKKLIERNLQELFFKLEEQISEKIRNLKGIYVLSN